MAYSSVQALWLCILALIGATARAAEPSTVEQRAREDLDRQLQALVKTPPPEVVITYEGLPGEGTARPYKLLEVDFILNGQPLAVPGLDVISGPGVHRLAALKVEEGSYTLVSRVTYTNSDSWSLFSEESGFLWKMTASVTFQAQKGLRMRVKVVPSINPNAPDPRLKLKLSHDVSAEMTAPLADATLGEGQDAGPPPVAVAQVPPPVTTPPVAVTQPVPPTTKPPEQGPVAPGKLLLKVLAGKKPVAATAYVRGGRGAPQQVLLDKAARKPAAVMLPPGEYTVDVLSKGFLAQTRQVKVSREREATVAFVLAPAPAKKDQQALVKDERVELPTPPGFEEKQAAPRKASTSDLALLVDMLVRDETLRLRLEGHTDNREAPAPARQALSEARAKAIADLLVKAGVSPSRIDASGLGDTRPKAPNLIPRGRELNRRVDILLVRGK